MARRGNIPGTDEHTSGEQRCDRRLVLLDRARELVHFLLVALLLRLPDGLELVPGRFHALAEAVN